MSFRLRIHSVETQSSEIRVRGRVIAGAYFGPQYVRFKDTAGIERTAVVLNHFLLNPQGWPVTADHETELGLCIAAPGSTFAIDTKSPLEGLGNVALRKDGIDLSNELSNPLFWGNFAVLHMVSESIERPYEDFLGLSQHEVNSYYTDFLSPLIDSGSWPVFPLEVDSDRYVEVEWAGGAEYQDRVWIGAVGRDQRALLGYTSGHFSLPGLRRKELVWLLDRLAQSRAHPASGLLLVPMCYLPKQDSLLTERLARLCACIPNARFRPRRHNGRQHGRASSCAGGEVGTETSPWLVQQLGI